MGVSDEDDNSFLVYEAAEDSWLLGKVVAEEISSGEFVLEVGCGSGYIAGLLVEEVGVDVVGVDINPHACRETFSRGIQSVRGDLVAGFGDETFDVVVFNPPYLPWDPDLAWDDWFDVAVVGGESGREVIARFIRGVRRVLRPDGVVFLLVSSVTGLDEVQSCAVANGFGVSVVSEEVYPGETLAVLKLQ